MCTECEGEPPGEGQEDCEHCGGDGFFLLKQCPNVECDQEIRDMCPLADLFKEGLPPGAGGSMDQSQWFFSAFLRLTSDENKIEAAKNRK